MNPKFFGYAIDRFQKFHKLSDEALAGTLELRIAGDLQALRDSAMPKDVLDVECLASSYKIPVEKVAWVYAAAEYKSKPVNSIPVDPDMYPEGLGKAQRQALLQIVQPEARGHHRLPKVGVKPTDLCARTFIYLRISKADANEEHPDGIKAGLEAQRTKCTAYIKERHLPGWSHTHEYVDDGVSAAMNFGDRPAGKMLLAEAREGDHIVFAKLDRGFRDILDCLATFRMWNKKKVNVHVLDMPYDLSSGVGELLLSVMAAGAQMERQRIRERTKEALHEKRKRGFVSSAAIPLGCRTVVVDGFTRRGTQRRKLIEDETEIAIMQLIHQRRTRRERPMALRQIADELNKAEIFVRGKKWDIRRVQLVYDAYLKILARREREAAEAARRGKHK